MKQGFIIKNKSGNNEGFKVGLLLASNAAK